MPNAENINRLIDWLKQDQGAHFKMGDWKQAASEDAHDSHSENENFCNTAFCLGGWIYIIQQRDKGIQEDGVNFYALHADEPYSYIDDGAKWLGIEDYQAARLFSSQGYSFDQLPHQKRSAAAIRTLEILRDENRVDWERGRDAIA